VAGALLIVDVQNDFMPGGALPVPDGEEVISPINELIASGGFDVVIATRDWHPPNHQSFTAEGGPWPPHCVAQTPGAELDARLDRAGIDAVVDKGAEPDAEGYSAFASGELGALLREEQVTALTVVGVATDYCVRRTALDALAEALAVRIDTSAVRGIDPAATREALEELAAAGAELI
jgi:nicotinamidase/pyrazinamidase